jgi:hypothetical protein
MTNGIGIIKILKHVFSSHVKTPLGRWNIHNHVETSLKIKYANEDNCGVSCHNSKNTTQQNDESENNEYMYVMGYESAHN